MMENMLPIKQKTHLLNNMRTLITISIIGILLCGGIFANENKSEAINSSVASIELLDFSLLSDGGTMGFIFRTHEGTTTKFCFDGRLNSSTKEELYSGDNHPENAQLVQRNSDESVRLISILDEYVISKLENPSDNIDNMPSPEEKITLMIKERVEKYKNSKKVEE